MLILAMGIQLGDMPKLRIEAATVIVAALSFLNAVFSAMYLVFQGAFLSLLLPGAMSFMYGPKRRRYLILLCAGWLSTAAGALVIATAPGFSVRLASTVYAELNLGSPIRDLPALLLRTVAITFEQIGHQPAFAGFALMLSLTLCLTLSAYRPRNPVAARRTPALAAGPLLAGLFVQALFLPILWSHTSDATQFLGRFSTGFFLVILPEFGADSVLRAAARLQEESQ